MEPELSIKVLPPVLTTEDVAQLLHINRRTVLLMAQDGRLPAHRLPGSRKMQYLTNEILETVAGASVEEMGDDHPAKTKAVAPPSASTDLDPCDVWGAAPAHIGEDRGERCLAHWIALATAAGLSLIDVTAEYVAPDIDRSVGVVEIDTLVYEVRVGPRQRTRYVDDDGEVRWGLIDAVWVEPLSPDSASRRGGARGAEKPLDAAISSWQR